MTEKISNKSVGVLKVCWLVAGIYVFFLAFGLAQERIYSARSPSGERFVYSIFLVLAMCLGNVVCSFSYLFGLSAFKLRTKISSSTFSEIWSNFQAEIFGLFNRVGREGLTEIALISLTYVISMLSTNFALTRVNFPTQVLVKSAKMVPVIVGGFVLYRKKYPKHDYLAVAVVTIGLICFNMFSVFDPKKKGDWTITGLLFLFVSLVCDGMTGPRQDRLLARIQISSTELMLLVNLFSSMWTFIASTVIEGTSPISFIFSSPDFPSLVCTFCITAAMGQLFIFECLKSLGSLYLTLITTTRKFFTVVLSVLWFNHSISFAQWTAVVLIFGTLVSHSVHKHRVKGARTATDSSGKANGLKVS